MTFLYTSDELIFLISDHSDTIENNIMCNKILQRVFYKKVLTKQVLRLTVYLKSVSYTHLDVYKRQERK